MLLNYGIFLIYTPRKLTFLCSEFNKHNTEIIVMLLDNSNEFSGSKYRDNIEQFLHKRETLGWNFNLKTLKSGKERHLDFFLLKQTKNLIKT